MWKWCVCVERDSEQIVDLEVQKVEIEDISKVEKFQCEIDDNFVRKMLIFRGEFSDENCGSVVVVGGLRNVEFRGECEA